MVEKTMQASPSADSAANIDAPTNSRAWIVAGIATIAATFGGFGTWAALASLDSAAIAPGVVVVESERKSVQHLEGGLVKEILVRNGDPVARGDVLVRLENTHAKALHDVIRGEIDAARAEAARLVAERDGLEDIAFPEDILARAQVPKVAEALQGQRNLFAARRTSLEGQVAIL
ncbi:MAG: biotin/lipoyl-binding protein, partial [Gammaproteobacteria bacterium]|nr:biotin/lipoyl-binding protein [Gammaproteobacteria bacterium]NIS03943.1 biotin/lipoyl-binding protein [Gammaproteobacteria bacterium]NIV45883.1 biotin/lipoyl-binding protein [Gammaproteobacteria bacterium]NIW01052.1 biotin/lipoyl-binding protein [Gammaproteobacteria bacterium]NIW53997.1 biotin/lipoyl-binding protein [Gammaproteobacteria bacterium]